MVWPDRFFTWNKIPVIVHHPWTYNTYSIISQIIDLICTNVYTITELDIACVDMLHDGLCFFTDNVQLSLLAL